MSAVSLTLTTVIDADEADHLADAAERALDTYVGGWRNLKTPWLLRWEFARHHLTEVET